MEIKEINELTHNWTADEFADFLHYLLQHGDHESMRGWWRSTSLLRKLEAAGLAELDGGEVALTPAGAELKRALYLLEESDGLAGADGVRRAWSQPWDDERVRAARRGSGIVVVVTVATGEGLEGAARSLRARAAPFVFRDACPSYLTEKERNDEKL